MSKKSIKCPNCGGPVHQVGSAQTIECAYCKHHFENPFHRRDGSSATTDAAVHKQKRVWALVLPLVFGVMIIGFVVPLVVRNTVRHVPPVNYPEAKSVQPAVTKKTVPPDIALEKKLDGYIDCLEWAFPRAKQSVARYLSWVKDSKKGPTCKERYITWGLYGMHQNTSKRCKESVEASNKASPALSALHSAASEFVAAAAALEPVMAAARDYYAQKTYKLDDCEKGKTLHPQLMALFEKLESKGSVFRQQIADNAKGVLKRCIERSASKPEMAAINRWGKVIQVGGESISVFREEAKKKKPGLDVIKKQVAALSETANLLNAVADNLKKQVGFSSGNKREIDDFVAGAIAFLDSKGGKKLNSTSRFFLRNGSARKTLTGTFENVVKLYNDVLIGFGRSDSCGRLLPCEEDACPER